MPVMDGYAHADTPHESTVKPIGTAYSCHSRVTGDGPRGRTTEHIACTWSKPVPIRTEWQPRMCGHNFRITDPECTGCSRRDAE